MSAYQCARIRIKYACKYAREEIFCDRREVFSSSPARVRRRDRRRATLFFSFVALVVSQARTVRRTTRMNSHGGVEYSIAPPPASAACAPMDQVYSALDDPMLVSI